MKNGPETLRKQRPALTTAKGTFVMAAKLLPDLEILNKYLFCDPGKGLLFWRRRPREMFNTNALWAMWNGRYADAPAFRTKNHIGYLYGNILRQRHFAHRVIWKMATGTDPRTIDHINGEGNDNRLVNLREVNHSTNMRNRKLSANNGSGANGVDICNGRYRSRINLEGRSIHIGMFDTLAEAICARKARAAKLGFTADHGER